MLVGASSQTAIERDAASSSGVNLGHAKVLFDARTPVVVVVVVNATMPATNALTASDSSPPPASPPPPRTKKPLVNSTSASAKNDDRALISMLDALLDGVPHGDARDSNNSVDDANDANARYYQANSTLHETRVRLFPCSSCKHKLEASAFERDRKTCRECLRRRRLRNQRKSRKLLIQRLLVALDERSAKAHASST